MPVPFRPPDQRAVAETLGSLVTSAPGPGEADAPSPPSRNTTASSSSPDQESARVQIEPLIEWPEPFVHLFEFAGAFLAAGAIGFRYSVLRGRLGASSDGADAPVYQEGARRAATIGLVGALMVLGYIALVVPKLAARRHVTALQVMTGDGLTAAWIGLSLLALLGFGLARAGHRAGWTLAAVGVVAATLRNAFVGQWLGLVNPLHLLAGGLWIGTLFVLVVAGIAVARRHPAAAEHRGAIVSDMVNRFSPLALGATAVLVAFGGITAWRHLKYPAALWTTPYGLAFVAKLLVVLVVVALGAWNWRRQRPLLGTEAAAAGLRRSATAELAVAGVVLLITSILVSLPSPKRPAAAGSPPPAAAAPAPPSRQQAAAPPGLPADPRAP
jgi:putative copper export protein